MLQKVVAIDGPCGSGKSSIAFRLAQELKMTHIDTGAMYRAIGYFFQDKLNININEMEAQMPEVENILNSMNLEYISNPEFKIVINNFNCTKYIRSPKVSCYASIISRYQIIRDFLTKFQRSIVQNEFCVMEGRDIGTVVFPQAAIKFFLTASSSERAKRRMIQLQEVGKTLNFKDVLRGVKERDLKDVTRDISPLTRAKDAILIDSDLLNEDEVFYKLKQITECRLRSMDTM